MLDIHTHLHFSTFEGDRDEVIQRARAHGVRQMILVACHQNDFGEVTRLAEKYEDLYVSIGIHPNEFRKVVEGDWLSEIKNALTHEKVVAVGECGLDFYSGHGAVDDEIRERQIQAFRAQLELAQEQKLPVIVHCRPSQSPTGTEASRDAYYELLEIVKEFSEVKIVLHCYMGDTKVTQEFLTLPNVYFSFTGNITYPVKKAVQDTTGDLTETVKLIPKERIFVETDCPFLAPQAKRGQRNEPAFVTEVAEKICELLGLESQELDRQLEQNFQEVFQKLRD